jgi:3-deoxy-D-manno-octulosonic-acid transferase
MMEFLFWGFYFPLIKVLSFLLYPLPLVRERMAFEKKNLSEYGCQSFAHLGIKADMAFEFSSEGEFQQAASLIQDALAAGKKIEIIYFSPSVERAMMDLALKHPLNLRTLRYPLLTLSLSYSCTHWMTSEELTLVRYDFLPEFLVWSRKANHKLNILWVSFKKDRLQGKYPSAYKRLFLNRAQKLFFASGRELETAEAMGLSGKVYDFRIEQIHRRVENRLEKFAREFPQYPDLLSHRKEKNLILGNAWVSDLKLLEDLKKNVFCLIVPHKLDQKNLEAFFSELRRLKLSFQEINLETKLLDEKDVYVLNRKGLLCELYSDFDRAYVGGGFDSSVHSLLEPLVAGSKEIACGPKNNRSTEFDLVEDLGHLKEVHTQKDFLVWLHTDSLRPEILELQKILKQYPRMKEDLISC